MSADSFGARSTLEVGGRSLEIFRLDALQDALRRRPAAVLAEDPAREPAAHRGRRRSRPPTSRRWRGGTRRPSRARRSRSRPARVRHAGLHRRARGRRPRRDARRDGRARRRPGEDQPARAGRARDRPLGAGRRVRHRRRVPPQRRARVRAQPRALRVPALGPGRVRRLPVVPPDTGIVHQVNLEYLARVVFVDDVDGRPDARVSRHARRHRLAHHDGQRPGRARLGRRRHRGRGGDARPADVDAHPAGRRLPARTASCPRARPRPTWCSPSPSCCASKGVVGKFVEFYGPGVAGPAARRPGHDRQHGARSSARRARSSRSTPRRCATSSSPGAPHEPGRARRGLRQGAGPLARRARRGADVLRHARARPRRRSCRRSPARSARRTACRSATRRSPSATRCELSQRCRASPTPRRGRRGDLPASDPPADTDRHAPP